MNEETYQEECMKLAETLPPPMQKNGKSWMELPKLDHLENIGHRHGKAGSEVLHDVESCFDRLQEMDEYTQHEVISEMSEDEKESCHG